MQRAEDFDLDEEEQAQERAHFRSILQAFDAYLPFSLAQNNHRRKSLYSLPRAHQQLLSDLGGALPLPVLGEDGAQASGSQAPPSHGVKARLDEIDDRIRRNADLLHLIVQDARGFMGEDGDGDDAADTDVIADGAALLPPDGAPPLNGDRAVSTDSSRANGDAHTHSNHHGYSHSHSHADPGAARKKRRIPGRDLDKVRSTLKQFVRDWSEAGRAERDAAYAPILDALERHLPIHAQSDEERALARVLVPGAGLGRLAWEIAARGFSCQGNEFSFFMLVTSHFILNNTTRTHEHTLYPYVHTASNWRTAADMLAPVTVPDVLPSEIPANVDFSMVAGDFLDVYTKPAERAAWHVVATCYFIDTARNLVRYLETLNHILPIGGIWINVGPLLWHYENGGGSSGEGGSGSDVSIELTLEEVLALLPKMGFEIVEQRSLPPQTYTGSSASMLTYDYHPEFWVAKKVRDVEISGAV